jgi:antitoxin component YwqK of YwqJK toxin-antitoxin module
MRCREDDAGPVVREQELRNGAFMGIVRYYKSGVLEREYSANDKGNREGLARDYAATPGATNQLLREETLHNGTTVGIARTWYPSGQLKRVSFSNDAGRTQAAAEFTPKGQLAEIRCFNRPLLAPHANDAEWCAFNGRGPSTVTLYGSDERPRGLQSYEAGELRKAEALYPDGKLREQYEYTERGEMRRAFFAGGVLRTESQFVKAPGRNGSETLPSQVKDFHESGKLVRERRWAAPTERGAVLALDQSWYLNGNPREKQEFSTANGRAEERSTRYHDNGQLAFEGTYVVSERKVRLAAGSHKTFDTSGRLRGERYYDAKGLASREREFDEQGKVIRDDELFEDGSRKAYSR